MRIAAYVLAADPVWIIPSIRSYYDIVDEILVSYDKNHKGWTGFPIPVDECIDRIRSIDGSKKVRLLAGDYARPGFSPMENDTHQRQCAIDAIGEGADWILELDTDEILQDARLFAQCLEHQVPPGFQVVEWPMRVFFQRATGGRFLEITRMSRGRCSEYPGPIATRPSVKVNCARRTAGVVWRVGLRESDTDPQTGQRYDPKFVISTDSAVLHMSWVRTDAEIERKLRSWSHSSDFNGERYLNHVWRRAPTRWMFLYNFHPIAPKTWPALWPTRLSEALVAGGLS